MQILLVTTLPEYRRDYSVLVKISNVPTINQNNLVPDVMLPKSVQYTQLPPMWTSEARSSVSHRHFKP